MIQLFRKLLIIFSRNIFLTGTILLALNSMDVVYFDQILIIISMVFALFLLFLLFRDRLIKLIKANWIFALSLSFFWVFSFFYIILFSLFQYGSPFIYESGIYTTKNVQYISLESGEKLSTSYRAETNHFGSVTLFFEFNTSSNEDVYLEEVETDLENQTELRGADTSLTNPVLFEIFDEKNRRIQSISREITSNEIRFTYPFGFPAQENSKDQIYTISIQNLSDEPVGIGMSRGTDSLAKLGRYVIPAKKSLQLLPDAAEILVLKSSSIVNEQVPFFLFVLVSLSSTLFLIYFVTGSSTLAFKYFLNGFFSFGSPVLILHFMLQSLVGVGLVNTSSSLVNVFIIGLLLISTTNFFYTKRKTLAQSFSERTNKQTTHSLWSQNKATILYTTGIISILLFGFWLRLYNLGNTALHHDEFFHYRAILGLAETGELGLYNKFIGDITGPYTRAALLTYVSYFSTIIFGTNEFAVRLPVALAGCILLVSVFFISRSIFGKIPAFIALLLVTFNPYMIYLDRFLRNYSFLALFYFLTVGLSVMWLKAELYSTQHISNKKRLLFLLSILISFVFTYHFGIVQAVTLLPVLLVCFGYYAISSIFTNHKKISLKYVGVGLAVVFLLILYTVLDYFQISTIFNIQHIINSHVDISKLFSPNQAHIELYYRYLFSFNFRFVVLLALVTSSIGFLMSGFFWAVIPALSTLVVYFAVAVLGDRYEDFRYITFAIPLIALAFSGFITQMLALLTTVRVNMVKISLIGIVLTFAVLVPTYPAIAGVTDRIEFPEYRLVTPQPLWTGIEGNTYIHRRAVAPDYKTVLNYINNHASVDDVFIFSDPAYVYLEIETKNVYILSTNSNMIRKISLLDDTEITLELFIEQNRCNKIWYVGTYMHLFDEDVIKVLTDTFINNLGQELEIKVFNYDTRFIDTDFTWPSLLVKPNNCVLI